MSRFPRGSALVVMPQGVGQFVEVACQLCLLYRGNVPSIGIVSPFKTPIIQEIGIYVFELRIAICALECGITSRRSQRALLLSIWYV